MKDDEKYAAMIMMAQRMDEDKVKEFMDMFTPSERLKFEEVLNNADLVYNYYIYKFNNKDSFYKIIFNGSPDHFLKFMKNKNYEFDIQNKIWSVK